MGPDTLGREPERGTPLKRRHATFALTALVAAIGVASVAAGVPALQTELDRAFQEFWDASSSQSLLAASEAIVATGARFDDVRARLKAGREYSKNVPTGIVQERHRVGGQEFFFSIEVPADYSPLRKYQVRFQLHGGVTAREENRPAAPGIGSLAGDEQIYVIPSSWVDAPWWSEAQVKNLHALLNLVKRTYNVDENRVTISGVSDGGTAAFYVAMRDTTPYASFTPLIGSLMLLASRTLSLADLFPNNLLDKPFLVVNGDLDPLYPTSAVAPVMRYLRNGGVSVDFRPQPDGRHDTAWWPGVREPFEKFVRDHPRNPLPDVLTWQRGQDDPFDRAHWLIVNRVDPAKRSPGLPDVNTVSTPLSARFGLRLTGLRATYVEPGSNAAAIGVRAQDVFQKVNDRPILPGDDLDQIFESCCAIGAPMTIVVLRNGEVVVLAGAFDPQSAVGPTISLFPRRRPSGRVDLVKTGNVVRATTDGVGEFTLLLSPDSFAFDRPVTILTNGRRSFEGRVDKDVATLLKWAAIDQDRTMLFAAELHVLVN
jgi:hypothetical protein